MIWTCTSSRYTRRRRCFSCLAVFRRKSDIALTDQIRRSSARSVRCLAEAWGRHCYQASFVSKLVESLGEAMETQAWLDRLYARLCEYVDDEQYRNLEAVWQRVGGMINKMIERCCSYLQDVSVPLVPSSIFYFQSSILTPQRLASAVSEDTSPRTNVAAVRGPATRDIRG